MNTPACRIEASWMRLGSIDKKLPRIVYRVPCMPGTKTVEHLGAIKYRADGRWNWWRKESKYHRTWVGPCQGVANNRGSAEMRVLDGWEVEDELQATRDFQEERVMTEAEASSLSAILGRMVNDV